MPTGPSSIKPDKSVAAVQGRSPLYNTTGTTGGSLPEAVKLRVRIKSWYNGPT